MLISIWIYKCRSSGGESKPRKQDVPLPPFTEAPTLHTERIPLHLSYRNLIFPLPTWRKSFVSRRSKETSKLNQDIKGLGGWPRIAFSMRGGKRLGCQQQSEVAALSLVSCQVGGRRGEGEGEAKPVGRWRLVDLLPSLGTVGPLRTRNAKRRCAL